MRASVEVRGDTARVDSAATPPGLPDAERGVSVIVCCHNSTERVRPTLEHLARQEVADGLPVEVIVVDNASADDLAPVVEACWRECGEPFPLAMIVEPAPGLGLARRAGVNAARYEFGVFCDDDNWLAADYLQRVAEILSGNDDIWAVDGSSAPALDGEAPSWFHSLAGGYAVGGQADRTGDVTARGYLWGAGLGFRTRLLKQVYAAGFQPVAVDRQRDVLSSGGDGEICCWFIFAGFRLWYDETLRFTHYIPPARLTPAYRDRLLAGFRASSFRVYRSFLLWKYGLYAPPRHASWSHLRRIRERLRAAIVLLRARSELRRIRRIEQFCRARGVYAV